jgi:hypothetical protein
VRLRALQDQRVAPPAAVPLSPEPKRADLTVAYAAVAARDAAGLPTALALPGAIVGEKVSLYAGDRIWTADVLPDGSLQSDGSRQALLRGIRPGAKIIAACDHRGNVLALTAITRAR